MAKPKDAAVDSLPDKDVLADAMEAFQAVEAAESVQRQEALDDIRFGRLSLQWPEQIRVQREIEGRPCLTINKIPAFVRQIINEARQNKPSINVSPSDSQADPLIAQVFEGLIRNIEYTSNADVCYQTALEHAVDGGYGYFGIDIDYACDDSFDLDIKFRRFANRFMVYGDPMSTQLDSSDWMTAFVVEDLKKDVFERMYPDADPAGWTLGPKQNAWINEDTIRRAEYWVRSRAKKTIVKLSDGSVIDEKIYLDPEKRAMFDAAGLILTGTRETDTYKVRQYIITGGEVLERNNWVGRYIPIIPVYGEEVNEEGRRWWKSIFRDAKDSQRMFNYWRTAATELVALAPKVPWVGPVGFADAEPEKWESANRVSYSYLQYKGAEPPRRMPLDSGPATGAIQEAMNSSDDMKAVMGLFDASLGAQGNETSGRAILARQRQGSTGTFHITDNQNIAIRHGGRIMIDLIPQIYTAQRVIRVMGENKQMQQVQLGSPMPPQVQPQPTPQNPFPPQRLWDLTVGKYDAVVKSGPSFNTRREEAVASMQEMSKAFPMLAPALIGPMARNMDFPEADEIARRADAMLPPNVTGKGPDPQVMQLQQQMQQMGQQLAAASQEVQKLQLQLEQEQTRSLKKEIDANIKVARAELGAQGAQLDVQKTQAANEIISLGAEQNASHMQEVAPKVDQIGQLTQELGNAVAELNQKVDQIPEVVAQKAAAKPRKGRAMKQPDGSWALEEM